MKMNLHSKKTGVCIRDNLIPGISKIPYWNVSRRLPCKVTRGEAAINKCYFFLYRTVRIRPVFGPKSTTLTAITIINLTSTANFTWGSNEKVFRRTAARQVLDKWAALFSRNQWHSDLVGKLRAHYFWDYSGIGIHEIDVIPVLLGLNVFWKEQNTEYLFFPWQQDERNTVYSE